MELGKVIITISKDEKKATQEIEGKGFTVAELSGILMQMAVMLIAREEVENGS